MQPHLLIANELAADHGKQLHAEAARRRESNSRRLGRRFSLSGLIPLLASRRTPKPARAAHPTPRQSMPRGAETGRPLARKGMLA